MFNPGHNIFKVPLAAITLRLIVMQILRLAIDYLEAKIVIIDNAVNVSYLFIFYFTRTEEDYIFIKQHKLRNMQTHSNLSTKGS